MIDGSLEEIVLAEKSIQLKNKRIALWRWQKRFAQKLVIYLSRVIMQPYIMTKKQEEKNAL